MVIVAGATALGRLKMDEFTYFTAMNQQNLYKK
jgi:hypothetical protein